MILNNLNSPNSFIIESFHSMLTSGLTFTVIDDKVFLTLNDNHLVNVEVDYDIPLEKQIFSLFSLAQKVKNVFEPKTIKRGLYSNTNYIFTEKRNYYAAPVWLHSNRIPDYFLLKINCEIDCEQTCSKCGKCDKCKCISGDVKLGFDIKNHPIHKLLFNYLQKAEKKTWKTIEKNNSLINLFDINGLDYTTGQFTLTFTTQRQNQGNSSNICSTTEPPSSTQFDSQFADHSSIFYLLPKDHIIIPYIFSFEIYFDEELNPNTTQGLYYKETNSQEFNFDISSINQVFNINIDLQRNNIPNDIFDTFEYNNNFWNTSTEIILPAPQTNQVIFKDNNGKISEANIKSKNLVEIKIDKINFNDILGVIHRENQGFNFLHFVYDENYSNIKLKLNEFKFEKGNKIILKNEAYNIEIIGIAIDDDNCCSEFLECVNYSGEYTQTFISKEVIMERYLLKVVTNRLVILKNFDFVNVVIGIDNFKTRVYNVRNNKEENETTFNINISDIPRNLLKVSEWKFTYKMPNIRYFTYDIRQRNIDILNEINDELNKIGLTNSFVDKDSLIIIQKSYKFLLQIVSNSRNLNSLTVNDFSFRKHNANGQLFGFNQSQFSGSVSNKNLIGFIPFPNELVLGKNSLAKINNHHYDLSDYELYGGEIVDYYTNFYLKDVLYPKFKGVIIKGYEQHYDNEICYFVEKFQPKLYELEVF